jgi:hypothetical protein
MRIGVRPESMVDESFSQGLLRRPATVGPLSSTGRFGLTLDTKRRSELTNREAILLG